MKEFAIHFASVQDVQKFVSLATAQPFPITVGNDFHKVNGKSFMEIFSLNFDYPINVWMECSDDQFGQFLSDAQVFLVK